MLVKRVENENVIECLYESSNILASNYDVSTNTLIITFKRGAQYAYKNVGKTDYTRFELADSQGKVLNSHIKKHEFVQLSNVNTEALINEIQEAKPKEMSEEGKNLLENMEKFIEFHDGKSEINTTLLERLETMVGNMLEKEGADETN
jgi:hypothetical protein